MGNHEKPPRLFSKLTILLPTFEAFQKQEQDAAANRSEIWYNWAQYTVKLPGRSDRAKLQEKLKKEDIPTMIYYQKPMHKQGAFAGTDSAKADCPVTERLCETVLSLPMHPYMTEEIVGQVADALVSSLV